jgi:hypothetical protein
VSTLSNLEAAMHRKIRLFLANGGKLKRSLFVSPDGCRCAIAACVPIDQTPYVGGHRDWHDTFINCIGIDLTFPEFRDLIDGFDWKDPDRLSPFCQLGARLADEYL